MITVRPMTIGEIAKAVGNNQLCHLEDTTLITNITTDSRPCAEDGKKENCLFVALRGENFDGHRFVAGALEEKSAYALVDAGDESDKRCIFCKDTEQGFLDIAGYYRDKYHPKIVGITGSVGKTTTKEMIAQVLSASYRTLKNEGNLNNRVGLPKTLFRLDESIEAAVIEMGMNQFGEISDLTRRTKPDAAVITNIGLAHIEFLGSREGILKAKLEILEGMKPGSPLILNGDDDLLRNVHPEGFPVRTYGVENTNCDIIGSNIVEEEGVTHFSIRCQEGTFAATIPTFGKHNVLNALAAFAVGREFDIQPETIIEALKGYQTVGMRQKIVDHKGIRVVEDCYNAGPDSMWAALTAFGAMPIPEGGRRIFVMGDMLELGEQSQHIHYETGERAAAQSFDHIYCYGKESEATVQGAKASGYDKISHFTDKNQLTKTLLDELKPNDTIWFKGGRGMKLEEVIAQIYESI